MFDIGFFELLLVAVVGLLVVGPERLPDAVRTTARWWSGLKRSLHTAKEEIEREVGADDIRRELHNERILRELEESRQEVEREIASLDGDLQAPAAPASPAEAAAESVGDVPAGEPRGADDHLPEDEDSELQDPEYPEHWHEHGDPELNEFHPHHHWNEDDEAAQADAAGPGGEKSGAGTGEGIGEGTREEGRGDAAQPAGGGKAS